MNPWVFKKDHLLPSNDATLDPGYGVHQSHESGPWWDRLSGRHCSTLRRWHRCADVWASQKRSQRPAPINTNKETQRGKFTCANDVRKLRESTNKTTPESTVYQPLLLNASSKMDYVYSGLSTSFLPSIWICLANPAANSWRSSSPSQRNPPQSITLLTFSSIRMEVGDLSRISVKWLLIKTWLEPPRCPFCSRKVQVFQEKSNNSQLQKLQDIMEKVAIAELTLDRKSEDGGWEGSHEEEEHLIRGKNTW